jgi:hypothetical protein
VPLVWLDLPLFDTPTFGESSGHTSSETKSANVISKSKSSDESTESTTATVVKDISSEVVLLEEQSSKKHGTSITPNSFERREKAIAEKRRNSGEEKHISTASTSRIPHKINWSSLLHNSENSVAQQPKPGDPLVAESRNQELQRNTPLASHSRANAALSLQNPGKERKVQQDNSQHSSPSYSFSYEVSDQVTKDVKSHKESRQGDVVQGEYSVLEPDGYTRVVTYTADADGFKAIVRRIPPT